MLDSLIGSNLLLALLGGVAVFFLWNSLTSAPRIRLGRALEDLSPVEEEEKGTLASLQSILDQADLQVSAREFLFVGLLLGLGLGGVVLLATAAAAMALAFVALGPAFYWQWLERRRDKREMAYNEGLSEATDIIRNSFSINANLYRALRDVADYGPPAVQEDFRTIQTAMTAGADLEEAMRPIGQRRRNLFYDMLQEALSLREEAGGSAREVLEAISEAIREQLRIYRSAMARQTEARLEATIVCLAPFVFFLFMRLAMREYAYPFYATPGGQVVLAIVVAMSAAGYWLARKIATSGLSIRRVEQK